MAMVSLACAAATGAAAAGISVASKGDIAKDDELARIAVMGEATKTINEFTEVNWDVLTKIRAVLEKIDEEKRMTSQKCPDVKSLLGDAPAPVQAPHSSAGTAGTSATGAAAPR